MDFTTGMARILHYLGFALYGGYLPAEAILVYLAAQEGAAAYRGRALGLAARLTRSHSLPGLALIGASGIVLTFLGTPGGITGVVLLVLVPIAASEAGVTRRLSQLAAVSASEPVETRLRGILRLRLVSAVILTGLVVHALFPGFGTGNLLLTAGAVLLAIAPFVFLARVGIAPAGAGILPHA